MADREPLLVRYKRNVRIRRWLLPWSSFQFGAGWHRFSSEATAPAQGLDEFETKWGVSLPESYRSFLETVGDGGAGPYYGISPLADWCAPGGENLPPEFLRSPFDPGGPSVEGLSPGALRICNAGCEHYYVLVVSGPYRGEMWHDASVDGLGLRRLGARDGADGLSFPDWLEGWLRWIGGDRSAAREIVMDPFWSKARFPGHAVAQVLGGWMQGGTVAVDQLPCPECVRLLLDARARLIVPSEPAVRIRNPKTVAMIAAATGSHVVPRQAFP